MDKNSTIATVQALRDELHNFARNLEQDQGPLWQLVQSADWLLDQLRSIPGETIGPRFDAGRDFMELTTPYVHAAGRFLGMMEVMKSRHPWLEKDFEKEPPHSMDLQAAGLDFQRIYKLTKELNRGISALRGQDNQPHHEQPGVPK